jgi:hypothetical protein
MERCKHGLMAAMCALCANSTGQGHYSQTIPSALRPEMSEATGGAGTTVTVGQQFPKSGILAANLNHSLRSLKDALAGQRGPVYCYVETSIALYPYGFVQEGSGPNFQGGLITLCTCKHMMRSSLTIREWPNCWVAGFSSRSLKPGEGRNFLAYLMKVGQAFRSQRDIWNALPNDTREAKAADRDRLGDLYRPTSASSDPYDPGNYMPPRSDHSHCNSRAIWKKDIDDGHFGRRPALLVGEPAFSFLWNRPMISLTPPPLSRNYERNRFSGLPELLDALVAHTN